ncbi:hypothetical protein Q8W71_30765 [Methylobacterium sp. NEAU 140]|uniref:hypothetical protein n=1 Tax=Methylobacterium sp. NEAU 140 TaxID=3064945 RepID=UPI002732DBE1|nr:hypothetical protein [Methylobacterium sp. NEAU 140]MDP4026975.1 hypothetical protein [Methylobacterium sp. NEAU 140]
MPTEIPETAARAAAARRLSWPDTARLLFLLARMRWFDRRLTALHRRVEREGGDIIGPAFLILARRWLATHEAIEKLLGCPVPRHVAQVRAILTASDRSSAPVDRTHRTS